MPCPSPHASPKPASNGSPTPARSGFRRAFLERAPLVDTAFYFVYWVSTFFFVLIVALMVVFVVRYRRRPGRRPEPSPNHNTALEIDLERRSRWGWSAIMFYLGFTGYMDMRFVPANAYEIRVVTPRSGSGRFTYPNGYEDANLHVPVDEPVMLTMMVHGRDPQPLYPCLPLKQDVVPGRYTKPRGSRPRSPGSTTWNVPSTAARAIPTCWPR